MLSVIRSILYYVWATVLIVPWTLTVLVASLFARPDTLYWMCAAYLRSCIFGLRVICGVNYRVSGMHLLPTAQSMQPIILCPKHQSTWETFALPMLMPHPLAYVFKREILRIPFFGWAIGRLDFIHIDRSNRVEAWSKVAEQGKRLLARGVWVIMFPEGTRTPRGGQGAYKSGATRLAVAAGAPVVPIAVTSAKCWPRKTFVIRPGTIDVSIGAPIPSVGRDAEDLMREVERWVEGEMRRLDPQAYVEGAEVGVPRAA